MNRTKNFASFINREVKLENKQLTVKTPVDRLKVAIASESVQAQFRNALKENSGVFVASLIDLYGSDSYLQQCEPKLVIMEALKAASLKLPINKNLGFAWIVPYKNKNKLIPQFQIGYKGYIQLAIRTGFYKYINADILRDGEKVELDKLSGAISFYGEPKSENAPVVGYFAHLETVNGFRKTIAWTREFMTSHAKRYSKSWGKQSSAWTTEFDKMAIKTMLRTLLGKYGIMSVEMAKAFESDSDDMDFRKPEIEANENANKTQLDIEQSPNEGPPEEQDEPTGPDF